MKKILSLFLSLAIVISTVSTVGLPAYAEQNDGTNVETTILSDSDDGVTDLFADVINEAQESLEAGVNAVSRITFTGSTAKVTLSSTVDSTLIVAVYSEDGSQLLGTGTEYVTEENTEVEVDIDINEMPQYFIAKGYIVDTLTMKPISEVYDCTYYTQDMQNLFESTVDTYDENRVINFDESETNNFAVYNENVIIETQSEDYNVIIEEKSGRYTIKNPSETLKNLKKGDILSLNSDSENLIVIKVNTVILSEEAITIIEDENIELDEVFDYVKISNSDDLYDNDSNNENESSDENITTAQSAPKKANAKSVNSEEELIGDNNSKKKKSSSEYSGSAKISGSLELSLEVGVDIFVTLKKQEICLYVDYGLYFNFNITVKGEASYKFELFSFPIIPGLNIDVTPNVTINFEVVMNLDISYTGCIGFKLDGKGQFTNISSAPALNGSLEIEGKFSVKFGLKIALTALYGLVSGYVNPSITLVITAELDNAPNHLCSICFAGALKYSADLEYGIEFLKGKKSFSNTVNIGNGTICEFYYSVSNNEWGKGNCPNKNNNKARELHCVTSSGSPAKFATVELYKKSCSCSTTGVYALMHRLYGLSHYTLYKSYRADSKGIIKFTLDAPEEGYEYAVKANYSGNSDIYYFPWGGGPVYPIEIKSNTSKSSAPKNYSLNSFNTIGMLNAKDLDTYVVESTEAPDGTRTIKYRDLVPNEIYNFYSLRDLDYLCSLVSSNILFVQQYHADKNGDLTISFKPIENTDSYEDCLLAMGQDNINIADANQCDLSCKDGENEVHPLVKVYGRLLQENVDYALEGEIKETTAGSHTFYIVGIGDYYGRISCNYNSTLYMDDYNEAYKYAQEILSKNYYSKTSINELKQLLENSNTIVSSTNDQVDIDVAMNEIIEKVNKLEYIDDFQELQGNLTWSWKKEEQSISVSGNGIIESIPWEQYKDIVKKIVIKDGITAINVRVFSDCPNLEEISVSGSVYSIGDYAFINCPNLKSVVLNEGVTTIGQHSFDGSSIEQIKLPSSVEKIGTGNFVNTDINAEITIFNSECNIDEGAIAQNNTIIGHAQSTAEDYAKQYSISFKLLPNLSNLLIKTVSLSLESSITMNFKVLKSAVADFENPYVVFNCEGDELLVTDYTEQGDYYVFSYPGISPQLMNDNVKAVLHASYNGSDYTSPEKVMSVREYAYTLLNRYSSNNYSKLRTLLVDLLNYGAAAQTYVGYQSDNLVNANLTDEQKSWGTSITPSFDNIRNYDYKTIENPTSNWIGSGLVLNNSVMVRAKFTADSIENKTVVITCGKGTFTYSKDDFVKDKDGNYYVYCNEIFANEMSEEILLTVYDNGVQCSNTMRFSIESYARLVHDSYEGTSLDELTTAMMRYGNSAKAYGA